MGDGWERIRDRGKQEEMERQLHRRLGSHLKIKVGRKMRGKMETGNVDGRETREENER